jgi:hypothetical protein
LAIGVGIVDGGSVVVVAESPTCIPDVLVSTGGAAGPVVSTPSAAPAAPAAMSAAPTTITARIFIVFCMKVPHVCLLPALMRTADVMRIIAEPGFSLKRI